MDNFIKQVKMQNMELNEQLNLSLRKTQEKERQVTDLVEEMAVMRD